MVVPNGLEKEQKLLRGGLSLLLAIAWSSCRLLRVRVVVLERGSCKDDKQDGKDSPVVSLSAQT